MKSGKKSLLDVYKYFYTSIVEKHLLHPCLLTPLLAMGLWQAGVLNTLELLGYNLLFNVRHHLFPSKWDERIAVIAIDDATLSKYGEFPLSRDRYTQLLETLAAYAPAAIGFDILFTEPTKDDPALAEAMEFNGHVVLAIAPGFQQRTQRPIPSLARVTTQGHIASNADLDGITRQSYLYVDQVPSLGWKLLEAYNNSLASTITSNPQKSQPSLISLPALQPQKQIQSVGINWIAPANKINTYSFINVIENKIDSNKLKNKIILIGLTATGAKDILKTPFEQTPPTSGIYLHAATIDNILNQRLLQKSPWKWEILLILTLGSISSFLLINYKLYQRILLLIFLPVTLLILSIIVLAQFNLWLPTVAPISTIFLAALTVQWQEQKEKQQLMSLFARHVSPETADLIWHHRSEIFQNGELEPQEMVATVLFSDIRSFTSISEGMKPKDLLNWLNSYLGAMAECVQEHHGVIDKYIGDAVMAVFGIPFPHHQSKEIEQDAISAVSAAILMQEKLTSLNQELEKLGQPRISIGIGIHTGLLVAGSIGGSQRLNYSVVGDAVNIAARLEQLNKNVQQGNPYNILVSETTFQLIKSHFTTQKVEQIQLRGRQQLTMIYAITGWKN